MAECRECDTSIPDEANFCPSCGAPQNEDAAQALDDFVRDRIDELPAERETDERALENRFSYALGWLTVVSGLSMAPDPASGFVVFGGIVILPPIRRLVGRQAGYTPGIGSMLLISLTSVAFGLALFLFV